MKTFNFKILFLLLITVFSVSSCSSDDSGESYGVSTGDYFPLAVNNSWKYLTVSQSLLNEIKITGTTQSGGTTYYDYTDDSEGGTPIPHSFAKNGATYFLKSGDTSVIESGITITIKSYQIPILKDDFAINTSWAGSVSPKVTYSGNGQSGTLPFKVDYTGVNYFKGAVTLNNITYPNVIKTRINLSINANNQITNASEEYWYAENIGVIEDIYTANNVTTIQDIDSYVLN